MANVGGKHGQAVSLAVEGCNGCLSQMYHNGHGLSEKRLKVLTQMNIQLDNVVSDLMGKTGTDILGAIIAGERDPQKLAVLRDSRLHADEETVARTLCGNWREEAHFCIRLFMMSWGLI